MELEPLERHLERLILRSLHPALRYVSSDGEAMLHAAEKVDLVSCADLFQFRLGLVA